MNPASIINASGFLVLAAAGLFAVVSVLVGTASWLGLPLPLALPLPPQTLVIAGLFLAVPVAMLGWGMIWLAGWLKHHR